MHPFIWLPSCDLNTGILLVVLSLLLVIWISDVVRSRSMPPGPTQWPLLGCLPQLALYGRKDILSYLKQLAGRYGPIFTLKFGDFRAVFISDYQLLKEAFVKQGDCFSMRPDIYSITVAHGNPKNKAIVMGHGHEWQVFRRFAVSKLKDMGVGKRALEGRIQDEISALKSELMQHCDRSYDPCQLTHKAVTNIIAHLIFGERYDYHSESMRRLMESIHGITSSLAILDMRSMIKIMQKLPLNGQYKKMISCQVFFTSLVQNQIERHRASFEPTEMRDLIDLCFKKRTDEDSESHHFTDDTMCQLIGDLFIAGSVTTATTLTWSWLYMAAHRDAQAKCRAEIKRVCGDKIPTVADRPNLPYTDATLCEIQRCATISPLAVMHSTAHDTVLAGYRIPKDTWVIPMLYHIHDDPSHFERPTEFRPERFLNAEGGFVKRESFIPYGIGPRACAGESLARMELFLFFSALMQSFSFSTQDPDRSPDLSSVLGFTQRSKSQGLRIQCL